jgi:hypothetical protein
MIAIISSPRLPGPVPDGLKVTAIPPLPGIAIGSFNCYPLSFNDNRAAFSIVTYQRRDIVRQTEVTGAQNITNITKEGSNLFGTVTFWGQNNRKVTLDLDTLERLIFRG